MRMLFGDSRGVQRESARVSLLDEADRGCVRVAAPSKRFLSRVLRTLENRDDLASLSTPCVKTGFVPKLLSRLGRDKSEGTGG